MRDGWKERVRRRMERVRASKMKHFYMSRTTSFSGVHRQVMIDCCIVVQELMHDYPHIYRRPSAAV